MTTERSLQPGVVWHNWPELGTSQQVLAASSTRHGGVSEGELASLNVGDTVGDDPARVQENRARLWSAVGVDAASVSTTRQVHGRKIVYRGRSTVPIAPDSPLEDADGMISDTPGVTLFLRFADCVPIFAYDPERQVIGLAHGGWRGTLAGIAGELVLSLAERFGSRPDDVRAIVGPSIGPCCYVVGPELVEAVHQTWPETDRLVQTSGGVSRLDLWEANRLQLIARGVPANQIAVTARCTACECTEFFSHRAQRGKAGRFAAVVALH